MSFAVGISAANSASTASGLRYFALTFALRTPARWLFGNLLQHEYSCLLHGASIEIAESQSSFGFASLRESDYNSCSVLIIDARS